MNARAACILSGVVGGISGGVLVGAIAAFVALHGTIKTHRIEVEGVDGNSAIVLSAGKDGGGTLDFYDGASRPLLSLGLQAGMRDRDGRVHKFTPFEALGDIDRQPSLLITTEENDQGVLVMNDRDTTGRLILGRIHWADTALQSEAQLWGLRVSGNHGFGQKIATVGLFMDRGVTRVIDPFSAGQK
jgi:hypothetical protein